MSDNKEEYNGGLLGEENIMNRKTIKEITIKRLYALSQNKCAFPNCEQQIFNEEGDNISNICHIEGAKEGSQRYNPNSNDEYRRTFENLILLCPNHHKETDNINIYTVDKLKEIKKNHESKMLSTMNISKNPSILNEVINLLSNQLSDKEIESSNNPPNIEKKITHNRIVRYKDIINEYKVYQGQLNKIYEEIDQSNPNKKFLLLQSIRNFYLEITDINDADDILDKVKEKMYVRIGNTNLPIETVEVSILIIIADAFMRCKILKEPK